MLEKEPCVGNLNRWFRRYSYNFRPDRTDTDIVDFHLDEAGSYGVKPGRQITYPDAWLNNDDRPIKMAAGDYDVKENRIRFAFCAENMGFPGRPGIDNLSTYFGDLDKRRAKHFSGH